MINFIASLIKYSAIFICILYAYTKLLRLKLKVFDLLDIPIFLAFSAALHLVKIFVEILVPIGFLIFGIAFLFLRFRKTFYETVTVGIIAIGIATIMLVPSFLFGFLIAPALYLINNYALKTAIAQLLVSIFQVACVFLLFKIKRLQSGVNPKDETATFEILLFFSIGCIFALMIAYTKNATQSKYETVILIIAIFGLLLILWWLRHIKYTYREAVKRQNAERTENSFEEFKLNTAEKDYQLAVYAKQFHYLNKVLPDCALLAERAATKTDCADTVAVSDMLQKVLCEMNLANEKCSLQSLPQTGIREIDAPIIQLFTVAERKNLKVSVEIFTDVESWFAENGLNKNDLHILLSYLCDNALNSALASPKAKVCVELDAINFCPTIRIYDSGKQFDEQVITKLGIEQITTRAGVGGSGIGLFTVFEILAKYGASFTLDEVPQKFGFTKFIEIVFDGRHSVTVHTCRQSVVDACSARKDITVETVETLRNGTDG